MPEPDFQQIVTGGSRNRPLKLALCYLAVASLWIVGSDRLLAAFSSNASQLTQLQQCKGLLFVIVTTLVIFALAWGYQWRMARAVKAFNATRDGILMTDTDGRIQVVNAAFTNITGYRIGEVIGRTPRLLQSGFHDSDFYTAMWTSLREQGYWEGELWNRHKNGSLFAERLSITAVRDENQVLRGYIGVISDISERKHAEERIRQLTHYNSVTDLPNRRVLRERGGELIRLCEAAGRPLVACYVDLDHFKHINDALGHDAGDALLRRVGDQLLESVRGCDVVTHWSGDEFVVLLPETERGEMAQIAARLQAAVSRSYPVDGQEIALGASVGVALFPDDGRDIDELLRHADSACHWAKQRGRNQVAFYSSGMNAQASEQLALESALRNALARGELELFYQPQLAAASNEPTGFEALLRWRHPNFGLIPPDRFIPIAESHGLMTEIGAWIIDRACRQAREWLDQGLPPTTIAVNLSAVQLRDGSLGNTVRAALARHALPPTALELELTESLLLDDVDDCLRQFGELKREIGVSLAIDDFGTGYSSLAYLSRFPASSLKIDRSFVSGLGDTAGHLTIVEAIINLGHNLHFDVIAEGVETEDEAMLLARLGCDRLQGYLIARPLPAAEATAWRWQRLVAADATGAAASA